ncbi:MAG: hypothetical protein NC253_11815 [Ruminococcus sp.]|nr:hypothetical protein [Ruminococcus sp.]MCM1479908.1 hypothetical protein [Muribaculaceae bacterium]
MKGTAEKNYKTPVKVLAAVLPIIAFIAVWAALEMVAEVNSMIKYSQYYACEIAGADAEKQADGSYIVTVSIKNNSSYQTEIYKNSIHVEYGNGTAVENRAVSYPDTEILRSINSPVVPAGRTVEYQIQIFPPEGINAVRLRYYGVSYNRYTATDEPRESTYNLKLS